MPRYYFHVEPLGVRDADGQNLEDDAAARCEAIVLAHDLACHQAAGGRIVVTNEAGAIVHEEQLPSV